MARRREPVGSYDEDYHYYEYNELPNGNYNCYKVVVATNGTTRNVLQEQITKEEYFKRKLEGSTKKNV